MLYIYKIATLNIHGLAMQPPITMVEDFLHKQEIDIFQQELTRQIFDDMRSFVAHTNIGNIGRGTEILTRDHILLTNKVRLPTGRRMAVVVQNVTLVNIYASSGAERRREREQFFASDLPYLLQSIPTSLLVCGDFNSVLMNADVTGHQN